MELTITALNVNLSRQSQSRIRQKTARMFERLGEGIQSIKVVINDINGPKGGSDKRCRIIISIKGLPKVVVTECQACVNRAVNIALARSRLTLLKKVKRKQKNHPVFIDKSQTEPSLEQASL